MRGTVISAPAIGLLIVLGGCTSSASPSLTASPTVAATNPAASGTATPAATAQPTTSQPAAATATRYPRLPIPAGTARCHTSQLEVAFNGYDAATGHVLDTFELRNRSGTPCWVYGYVGYQLLDAAGRPRPQTLVWTTDTFFIKFDPPTRILLAAGTAALHTGRGEGHAFFDVEADDWTCPADQANATASLRIWPPDEYVAIVIPAKNGSDSFIACGQLALHPLQIQPGPSTS